MKSIQIERTTRNSLTPYFIAGPNMSDYKPSSFAAVSPPTPTTDGNSTTSHQSETPASPSPSMDDNDITPPFKPQPPPPKSTSFPVREDCWSEAATSTLIEAWGDRFLQLNRGNLRQKHWQEVADAVNARHGHVKKDRRTDVQCKNRIDTLKKKYKVEKAKASKSGSHNYVSPWPFFAPLDSLIGSVFKPSTQTLPPQRKRNTRPPSSVLALPPPPSSVPVRRRSKRPAPPVYQPSTDSSFFRRNFSVMAAAAAAIDGADGDSDTSCGGANRNRNLNRSWSRNGNEFRYRMENEEETVDDPYRQLAMAIGRFSEVYARVEEAKQRQMVELEKQRMQFTKDLELQRMKLLMESQMQLEKLKRPNTNSETDFHKMEEDHSTSIN